MESWGKAFKHTCHAERKSKSTAVHRWSSMFHRSPTGGGTGGPLRWSPQLLRWSPVDHWWPTGGNIINCEKIQKYVHAWTEPTICCINATRFTSELQPLVICSFWLNWIYTALLFPSLSKAVPISTHTYLLIQKTKQRSIVKILIMLLNLQKQILEGFSKILHWWPPVEKVIYYQKVLPPVVTGGPPAGVGKNYFR